MSVRKLERVRARAVQARQSQPCFLPSAVHLMSGRRRAANSPGFSRQMMWLSNSLCGRLLARLTMPFSMPPGSREKTTWAILSGSGRVSNGWFCGMSSKLNTKRPTLGEHWPLFNFDLFPKQCCLHPVDFSIRRALIKCDGSGLTSRPF